MRETGVVFWKKYILIIKSIFRKQRPSIMVEFSLTISNYNHAHFLPTCLDSVFSQTRIPDEILIVDDCSTDGSVDILSSYARRYPSISLSVNESRQGVCRNINQLFAAAKGRYVANLAADDMWLPGFVEKSLDMLHLFPEAALCCSNPAYLDGETGKIIENRSSWTREARYFTPGELALIIRSHEGCLFGHTCIMKKETFLEAGGYLEEVQWHADWLNLLVQGFRHGICFIPEALSALRISATSYSGRGMGNWHRQREALRSVLLQLGSEPYADVANLFADSGVLNSRGDEIVLVTAEYDELCTKKPLQMVKLPALKYSGLQALSQILRKRLGVNETATLFFQKIAWDFFSSRRWLWRLFWRIEHFLRLTVRGALFSIGWRKSG